MNDTVLITGGAGFIGSHLAQELLHAGYKVRVLDSLVPQVHGDAQGPPDYLSSEVEFIRGDVRDRDAVRRAIDGAQAVFHFAAAVGVGQSMYEIEQYTSVNTLGTAILLEAIMERPVEKVILASSMSIYGEGLYRDARGDLVQRANRTVEQLREGRWEVLDRNGEPLQPVPTDETKYCDIWSIYALGKYDQEQMVLMTGRTYGFDAVALRFFNVFGPWQALSNPYTGVLAIFASRLLNENGRCPEQTDRADHHRQIPYRRYPPLLRRHRQGPKSVGIRAEGLPRRRTARTGRLAPRSDRRRPRRPGHIGTGEERTDPMTRGKPFPEGLRLPTLGVTADFPTGDRARLEQSIRALESLDVHHLRVAVCPTRWTQADAQLWCRQTLAALARRFKVLPAIHCKEIQSFDDEVESLLAQVSETFEWIECRLDSPWTSQNQSVYEVLEPISRRCRSRGIRILLGGVHSQDPVLAHVVRESGQTPLVDGIGLIATPDAETVHAWQLEMLPWGLPVWVTETSRSTKDHDEFAQVKCFVDMLHAGPERLYWSPLWDRHEKPSGNGSGGKSGDAHRGLLRVDGTPKLLCRIWQSQGIEGVRRLHRCELLFHFAAQVAVTTSLVDPMADFEANLRGTLNVLEAARHLDAPPPLLFTSTNKVYGDLSDLDLVPLQDRYVPSDADIAMYGINERRPLSFHSPYGCSKGAADQYVLDYAQMFGMPNVVFRMNCIYGWRQFGTEDQGWVAHFAHEMLRTGRLNIYGDGRQVRDLLYVDDLIDAMLMATTEIDLVAGKAFNVGGGPANAVSLLEVIDELSALSGVEPELHFGPSRKGDQPYYVSDTRRLTQAIGWTPRIPVDRGIPLLYEWIMENAQTGVLQSKE